MLETRYGEVNLRCDYGQYCLLFLQVSCDDTVSGKTKDPAGFEGLGLLIRTLQFDFEGPVRPASRDGMDLTVIQADADEQIFNIPGFYNGVLNDRSAYTCPKGVTT